MKTQLLGLVRDSLVHYLHDKILTEGGYINIGTGTILPGALEVGKLSKVQNDPIYGANRVWQSPYINWVHEISGTFPSTFTAPTIASGVWITGGFFGRNDSPHAHSIDYYNGRIIFNSAQSSSLVVRTNYSYKEVNLSFAYQDSRLLDLTRFTSAPETINQVDFPSGSVLYLPALFIQYLKEDSAPLQIGGGKNFTYQYVLHAFAKDINTVENITSLITKELDNEFKVIDFRSAPTLFNQHGDRASTYITYSGLKANNTIFTGRFSDINSRGVAADKNIFRTSIFLDIEVPKDQTV